MVDILTAICHENHLNLDLRQVEKEYRQELNTLFQSSLKPVKGVPEMLELIDRPMCVASNGPVSKMLKSLSITGLLPHFESRLFSAFDAGIWKPDPGLLRYAADKMGVSLDECILVEDSVPGVMAGVNGGVRVFHYCADEHSEPVVHPQVTRFSDMHELPALIREIV